MTAPDPLIAMKAARVLVPETDVELVHYAAFCHGLREDEALTPEQRAALASALDAFRAVFHGGWVGGTAFLTHAEMVFIAAAGDRAARPAELAIRVPLADILALDLSRGALRDTLTIRTTRGRFKLRCFMARRFRARIEQACVECSARRLPSGLHAHAA
jgi:hypothetical protein